MCSLVSTGTILSLSFWCPMVPPKQQSALGFFIKPEAVEESFAPLRAANTKQWKVVFEEDIFVVEGMQRGRSANGFDGGRFSPVMDGPTHNFHQWVASNLINNGQA